MIVDVVGLAFRCVSVHVEGEHESSLTTPLDPEMGGQQLVSMIACKNVWEYLTKDTRRRMVFHCPSHEGIERNEAVDEEVES